LTQDKGGYVGKKILVVAAHPDDEILGCGGTMAIHSIKGDEVYVLILGEGITSRDVKRDRKKRDKEIEELRRDIEAANKIEGTKRTFLYDFPDNRFDSVPLLDIIKVIEKVKNEVVPDIVYTHHHGDLYIDHRLTFQAVMTACRPLKGESVKEIYSFEVPSSTEWSPDNSKYFMPNYFVNIKDTFQEKIKAMKAYTSEIRDFPHPRSARALEILACNRGISVGLEYAEAFEVIRQVRG
jgi:LmbE family N-acetylglucosaminyl deacetylase